MASPIIAARQRTYEAHQQDTLLSEVVYVTGVLLPRAVAFAGIDRSGMVLVIHQSEYDSSLPEWDAAFFEERLVNEPLLALAQQARAVFIAGDQQLVVPDALFDQQEAAQWMKALYPVSPADELIDYPARPDGVHYLLALPQQLRQLVRHYLPAAQFLPVAAYQFYKPAVQPASMQCLIGPHEVVATLRKDGQILWHQVFGYQSVTDIVWQFAALCRRHSIPVPDLQMEATVLCDSCYELLPELQAFFPNTKWTAQELPEQGAWAPTIFLMQQLYACAL